MTWSSVVADSPKPPALPSTGDAPPDSGTLVRLGTEAAGWAVGGSLLKLMLAIAAQAVLARLLGPAAFGLFAIAMLVYGAAAYFADSGMATGLVQQEVVTDADVRFVFAMNLLLSSIVAVAVWTAAPWLAALFGKPEAASLVRAMTPAFVLSAASSVSLSLLRRRLDYRSIQLAQVLGYALGFAACGIGLVLLGAGPSALAAGFALQAGLTWVLLFSKARHPLLPGWPARGRRHHVATGTTVLATNLVNWLATSLDRLVVGREFSAQVLGLYSVSNNLVYAPVNALYPPVQSVVFSATARVQGQTAALAPAFRDLLAGVVTLVLPLFAALAVVTEPLVLLLYGDAWREAAPMAAAFAVAAPFLLAWGVTTPFLWNAGRRSYEYKLQLPFIAIAAVLLMAAANVSTVAVAWTAATLFIARAMVFAGLVARVLRLPFNTLTPILASGALLAAASALCAWLSCQALRALGAGDGACLTSGLVAGAVVVVCGAIAAPSMLPALLREAMARRTPGHGRLARAWRERMAEGSKHEAD